MKTILSREALVASRYNYAMSTRHGYLVHNTKSGAMVLLDENEYSILTGPSPTASCLKDELVEGGFLVSRSSDEVTGLREDFLAWRRDSSGLLLTIAPTLACNFRCSYCFQKATDLGRSMNQAVERSLIEFAQQMMRGRRHLRVVWYGGEPLLKLDTIVRLSEKLTSIAIDNLASYHAALVTNGWLLVPQTAALVAKLGVRQVQITLDGPPDVHDQRRVLARGGGTFDRILDNILAAANLGAFQLAIRVNLDLENVGSFSALLHMLESKGLTQNPHVRVYPAPVLPAPGCGMAEGCLSADEWLSSFGAIDEIFTPIAESQNPLPPRKMGPCLAIRDSSFVVGPTGRLYKCWEALGDPKAAVGNVLTFSQASEPRCVEWHPFKEPCLSCPLLSICMGGCPNRPTTGHSPDSILCRSVRHRLEQQMLASLDACHLEEEWDYPPRRTAPSQTERSGAAA